MKFLLHGNSPEVPTGYGIQIKHLAERLMGDGHDVAVSCTYGLQMTVKMIPTKRGPLRLYGQGFDVNSNDRLHMHANHHFGGEPGWIILVLDVWAMNNPLLKEYDVVSWVPVDHWTPLGAPQTIRQFFAMSGAVPVTMSKFGAEMLTDLDPTYIPLSVDTDVYRPISDFDGRTAKAFLAESCGTTFADTDFVVGMVGMNKGWARDRKGFGEAFAAFGYFAHEHGNAHLVVHADRRGGAEGIDLVSLAVMCGIPEKQIHWTGGPDQYATLVGMRDTAMAVQYSAFDVLLAPSHGEGFCVPLIEAQACGTPVIATDFSAQPELVGAGWKVTGQQEWDPAHHAFYKAPHVMATIPDAYFETLEAEAAKLQGAKQLREFIQIGKEKNQFGILDALEAAYEADKVALKWYAVQFAEQFGTDRVYEKYWRPFIAKITAQPEKVELEREAMPDEGAVTVICPTTRPDNALRLQDSFDATTDPDEAILLFIDGSDRTFAEGANLGYCQSDTPWVMLVGDDCVFHDGWLDAARKLSADFDVIGTNDTAGAPKNPRVARGVHADHFFVRRAYVEKYGSTLDGPGVLAPEAYKHWYTDREIIDLARARGVFTPCLASVVEHLHPGYDGDEEARQADPTYMRAVEWQIEDARTFEQRQPLIEMARR